MGRTPAVVRSDALALACTAVGSASFRHEPVLDVEVAHPGVVVEVVVGHVRVAGRRRDHDGPERGSGGRRVGPLSM